MSVYPWATNVGAREEPTAGVKASGFIPNTPAPAKILNDVLGELSDAAIDYQTKFPVQHDIATGFHTDITAEALEVSKAGDQWTAFGLDGFAVKLESEFVDLNSYPFRVNQAGNVTCNAIQSEECYSLSYGYGSISTPVYKEVSRYYMITQATSLGDGAVSDIGAGLADVRQFELAVPGAGTALFPFERPVNSYIKKIGIYYVPNGDDYTLNLRVYGLSSASLAWTWDGDIDGTLTGGAGEGGIAQYKEITLAGNGVLGSSSDVLAGLRFNCTEGLVVVRAIKIVYRTTSVETML